MQSSAVRAILPPRVHAKAWYVGESLIGALLARWGPRGVDAALDSFLQRQGPQLQQLNSYSRRWLKDTVYHFVKHKTLFEHATGRVNMTPAEYLVEAQRAAVSAMQQNTGLPTHIRASCPLELFEVLKQQLGSEEKALQFCLTSHERGPMTLHIKPGTSPSRVAQILQEVQQAGATVEPLAKVPKYGYRLDKNVKLLERSCYKSGLYRLMDEGSMHVASLVRPGPTETVLDYCAGAGTKTILIGWRMANKGHICVYDKREHALCSALQRTAEVGITNVTPLVTYTARRRAGRQKGGALSPFQESEGYSNKVPVKRPITAFDWVLLDVPCTGTGTLRRHPEHKYRLDAAYVERMVSMQQGVVKQGFGYLKKTPGSRLVYSTCSVLPAENEAQRDMIEQTYPLRCVEEFKSDVTPGGMDGMYAAVFERTKVDW